MTLEAPERLDITSRGNWLELRRHDVTASEEVAALFDAHPYRTRLQVYLSKTSQDGDQGDNPAMRRGRIMEPAVAAALAEEKPAWGADMVKAREYWRLPKLHLGATPDYYIGTPGTPGCGILECKTVNPEMFHAWGGVPPLAYTLQVSAQMMTSGATWGVIALMVMNWRLDLFTYPVPRHHQAEMKIAAAVRAFWGAVERGEAPPPTMPADRATLAHMFRQDDGSAIDLSSDNALPALLAERAQLAGAAKRIEEINDEIKAKMGTASIGRLPGWIVTYKTHHRKAYTVAEQDVRQLRITAEKDSDHE